MNQEGSISVKNDRICFLYIDDIIKKGIYLNKDQCFNKMKISDAPLCINALSNQLIINVGQQSYI